MPLPFTPHSSFRWKENMPEEGGKCSIKIKTLLDVREYSALT